MSRSSRRNLITPVGQSSSSALPVNSQQIHDLISSTNEKDMLFYEYEIVDKDKEAKWASKQARKYGMCLCSRWLFMIIGNAILIALTCSTCAILIYVNTPVGITVKPLSYGDSCVVGSNACDSVRLLSCSNSICDCTSGRTWNGTDCACATNKYWDGLACLDNQGYQQPCSSSLPCHSMFVCDPLTSTCLCASTSTTVYTHYYTGGVTNLYSGTCQPKGGLGSGCLNYGVSACQEYNGLTCSLGAGGIYTCNCYSGYYLVSGACTAQGAKPGASCTGSTAANFGCFTNTSMECTAATSTCNCPTNYYWNNNTNTCKTKEGYKVACYDDSWCNSTLGLVCYFSSMTACNCPTTSTHASCDCPSTKYWDGQQCSNRVGLNSPCPGTYACTGSLQCLYGYCL